MKKIAKKSLRAIVLTALCAAQCAALCCMLAACVGNKPAETPDPIPPVKVGDGIDFEVAAGKSRHIAVADYITVNDYAPSAQSDSQNATATVAEGLMTVTGVAEGDATVTLSCGEITIAFGVTVFIEYKVTVDGAVTDVRKGGEFVLPSAPAVEDENFEFDYWLVGDEHKNPGDTLVVNDNVTVTSVTKRKAAVKVKDGDNVTLSTGRVKQLAVADYITAYGAEVAAASGDPAVITVSVADGKIAFTSVAAGTTIVTVTCGRVSIEFAVSVTDAPAETFTVTVDGEFAAAVEAGDTYTLPAALTLSDPDFAFVGWNVDGMIKQPGDAITVESDLDITAKIERKPVEKIKDGETIGLKTDGVNTAEFVISEYIDKHGNAAEVTAVSQSESTATAVIAGDKLIVTAVAVGNTAVVLTCGNVTVTFTVNVSSSADGTPEFENGAISFDLYDTTSGSYMFEITAPEGSGFTYSYTVTPDTGVSISGNTLVYTATETVSNLVLTVGVTATDPVLGSKTTSFTVTVNVTDTSPAVKDSAVIETGTRDFYDGAIKIDLADNIENAEKVSSYKVNGIAVSGTEYEIASGDYTDVATAVTVTVEAVINATKSVSYTYTVNVIDSTAYRLFNGGFDSGLDGWTKVGEIGNISEAEKYWTNENGGYSFNADGKFFSAYEPDDRFERNMGTLASSSFKVSSNRIITFKLGGAQHDIFVDVVDASNGAILARYGNSAWAETTNGVKSGCTMIAYKATLPQSAAGKTVYIRVIDMAKSYYGVLFCDSFVTYYAAAPASGFIDAAEITDRPATVYEIHNGGFESGMSGWIEEGGDIGDVTSDNGYWNGGNPEDTTNAYGKEGDKLFSWWSWNPDANDGNGGEVNREGNMGTLTSSMFVLRNNKYAAFMIGGENRNIYVELVNAENGTIMAVFRNDNRDGGKLKSYHYAVSGLDRETLCYFRIVDAAVESWGCFSADGFKTDLDSAPEGSAAATNRIAEYKSVVNGSFESGDLNGWTAPNDNALGKVVNTEIDTENWYQPNTDAKDGDYLFTFFYNNGAENVNTASATGIIRSSAFILQKNGIVSFRFGAAHNRDVYIDLYTADGRLIARFRNNAYTEATVMVQYYYQWDNAEETSCYFEIVDNATVGPYGCIVMDDFRVNLDAPPTGAVLGSEQTKAERNP